MAAIINELLCYILNKIDSIPQDTLVQLIAENFSEEEVEAAKGLLCSHVDEPLKAGNRRGQNKKKLNIQDIYRMALECDRAELPKFVALDLAKLPPISIDCIDVSALMRKQQIMEVEMSQMKTMLDDVLKVSVETSRRVDTVLSANSVDGRSSSQRNQPSTTAVQESTSSLDGYAAAGQTHRSGNTQISKLQEPAGQGQQRGPAAASYAAVAAAAASTTGGDGSWTVANRAKRGKVPAVSASGKATSAKKSVVGLQKSNVITAVKSVKRVSLFVSMGYPRAQTIKPWNCTPKSKLVQRMLWLPSCRRDTSRTSHTVSS